VVKLLLANNAIDSDLKDKYSWTPLWLAAENRHGAVVKLLLANNAVDPDSRDIEYGQTPLSIAAALRTHLSVELQQ
jgi:ankyrin repeat protein